MIRLDTTTRKLEIVLAGAITTNQLAFVANWSDGTSSAYAGGATPGVTNGTTAVTLVASPASGAVRDVDCIDVVNLDTVATTVTIRYNDNATLYTIFKAALAAGDQLTYTHGQGWRVLDQAGNIKTSTVAARSIKQVLVTNLTSSLSGTTLIPWDNTIPQQTEGDEYMTVSITPSSPTSMLIVTVSILLSSSALNNMTAALFQDSVANALSAQTVLVGGAYYYNCLTWTYTKTAGSTAPTTFKVRAGGSLAATTFVNTPGFGGVTGTSLMVTELLA